MKQKLQELIVVAQADPKKAIVLGALMIALVVIGARQFLGAGPSSALAQDAVDAVREEALGLSDIEQYVHTGPTTVVPAPSGALRDLFRFDERHFPLPVEEQEDEGTSAKSDDSSDDPTPGVVDPSAQQAARIREEAERFRLRSTLLGTSPVAVFDFGTGSRETRSTMLRIGEVFRGFTLVSVSHRQAVIEQGDLRFTLHVSD